MMTKSHHLDWRLQLKAYRKQEKHWSLRCLHLQARWHAGPLANREHAPGGAVGCLHRYLLGTLPLMSKVRTHIP